MGGLVKVAVRQEGLIRSCVMNTAAASGLFWQPNLFEGMDFPSVEGDELVPHDYGLVVVDYDTRWIGSAQGYFTPATTHPSLSDFSPRARKQMALVGHSEGLVLETFCQPLHGGGAAFHHPTPFKAPRPTAGSLMDALQQASSLAQTELVQLSLVDLETFKRLHRPWPEGWSLSMFNETTSAGWSEFSTQLARRGIRPNPSELKQWDDYMDFLRTMTGTDTSPRSIQAFHAPYLEQRLAQSLPEGEPTAGRSRRPRV